MPGGLPGGRMLKLQFDWYTNTLGVSPDMLGDVLDWFSAKGHYLACLFIGIKHSDLYGDLWNVTCKRNLPEKGVRKDHEIRSSLSEIKETHI